MIRFDDETLMRRIDGELDTETAQAVDAGALTDAALADRLAALRTTTVATRAAFPAVVDPRDAALAQRIASVGASSRTSLQARWFGWLKPPVIAAGAGLALAGFVAGVLIAPGLTDRPTRLVDAGGRIADAGLVQVLDTRLSAEGLDDAGRAIGLTFQDGQGRWCRTFLDKDAAMAGLACRSDEGWTVQALASLQATSGELRLAASDTPAPILLAVDDLIAGDTANAALETRAREAGFR